MARVGLRGGVLVLLLCAAASFSLRSATPVGSAEPVRSLVEQALSARAAGKGLQEQEILERGLEAVGSEDPASDTLYQMLGQHHADLRNRVRAAELSERALKLARAPLQEHAVLARLVSLQRARSDRVGRAVRQRGQADRNHTLPHPRQAAPGAHALRFARVSGDHLNVGWRQGSQPSGNDCACHEGGLTNPRISGSEQAVGERYHFSDP